MQFSWNAAKSAANYRQRGFDFEFATLVFNGPTLEKPDRRSDYGELRLVVIGLADGIHLTVVYTDRPGETGTFRRIISARRSNRRERRAYDQAYQQEA